MTCQGLLADVNVQGHLQYLVNLLQAMGLSAVLEELDLRLATFLDLGLDRRMEDRPLWEYCQQEGWVLLTDNRNHENEDSLQATLDDSWHEGHLPLLTISNKGRFEDNRNYADKMAEDVATVLFGIVLDGQFCDRPRIYVPFQWP